MDDTLIQERTEGLLQAMKALGRDSAEIYQDRGPLCVRVPITDDPDEYAPSLFIFLDHEFSTKAGTGYYWTAAIDHCAGIEDLHDVSLRVIDRAWMCDVDTVAAEIEKVRGLLEKGTMSLVN